LISENKIVAAYRDHAREILIFLNRLTGSVEISEDILHDAFANLVEYSEKKQVDNIRAFLYRTAHNLALNYIRKNKRLTSIDSHDDQAIPCSDDTAVQIEKDELESRIYAILRDTDEDTRSFFVLRKENGLSVEEIAEITGKSSRTVRRKLKNITDHMHAILEKEGFFNN